MNLQREPYPYIWWTASGIYESMPSRKKVKSLKNRCSLFFGNRRDIPEPESSMYGTYPSLSELFKDSQDEMDPVPRNMDANMLQPLTNYSDKSDQRTRELEGSLGLALQAIQRLEARVQASKTCKPREEPKKAPVVLMENNLTKAKSALMTPKLLCPTGANLHSLESKANPGEKGADKLTKLTEVLIKKSGDYRTTFPKYV